MKIVLIGAGNLATQLGKSLLGTNHQVVQVYSRTMQSASLLARQLNCSSVNDLQEVTDQGDIYFFSVKDSALESLVEELSLRFNDKIFLHTAGSMPMELFKNRVNHYGVFYPMQTFSKNRDVDFKVIPCFIEANDEPTEEIVRHVAESLSEKVYHMSSDRRKYLHLAAVWACNFVNHCYDISSILLDEKGIPFDVMWPLIDETARKVHLISPKDAQTGPAVRYDRNVMDAHCHLMDDRQDLQHLYRELSDSIHKRSNER